MSSKVGPRVTGTDGSDFWHRERVAPQYGISAANKWRLKAATFLHFSMVLLMLFRLSTVLCVMFGIRPPSFLQRLKLPRPQTWEYVWLVSTIPSIFALVAIKKNRLFLMQQYLIGMVIFGIGPIVYAIYDLSDDLMVYWDTKKAAIQLMGYPMVVLWNMFLCIALQVHFFAMYFAYQLIKAWRPKTAQNNYNKTK